MGELFERTVPDVPLSWTGERLTTNATRQVEIEHIHRYFVARQLCRGLDVLDVAAGEGYGSALLAQTARSVVGVELDAATVAHATLAYTAPNLTFLEGDARRIPLPDGAVDAVVSFETIEHFYEHELFLAEVKRVLRPGGRFIVSSPERDVYSPAGAAPNPYHVRELTRAEFLERLSGSFAHVAVQGQRPMLGSALVTETLPEGGQAGAPLTFERRGPARFEASVGLPRAVYLLAIASDAPLGPVADSLYIETGEVEALLADVPALREEAARLRAALDEAGGYARHLEAELAAQQAAQQAAGGAYQMAGVQAELRTALATRDALASQLADAQAAVMFESYERQRLEATAAELAMARAQGREAEARVAAAQARLADAQAQFATELAASRARLEQVLHSTSWQVTRPMRAALARAPGVRRRVRQVLKLLWWSVTLQLRRRLTQRAAALAALRQPAAPPLSLPPPPPAPQGKAAFIATARARLAAFLASDEVLEFAPSAAPAVSVIIVLWNQAHFTYGCLRALQAQAFEGPAFEGPEFGGLEVVLVDNASTDETEALLGRLQGVTILRNQANAGFVFGCNAGAAAARGEALLLLNNDAFLRPGSIAAALATLRGAARIGAIAGRLVLPDGRLQEAGSIVWADGSSLGYGRGLAEDAGEAMFRRDVDYGSGAFLLTPRRLWEELGGFDAAYAPAYYEDTDYCMRLREAGYRVVYEPAAAADHFEYGSEAAQGEAVAQILRRRAVFIERHAATLRRDHLPPSDGNVLAARISMASRRRRLLVIDNDVPLAALGSGYPRAREMLAAAQALGWFVTLYPLHRLAVDWAAARAELPAEIEIIDHRGVPGLAGFLRARSGYYDAVMVSRPDNMSLLRGLLPRHGHVLDGTRLIYDAEAVSAARDIGRAAAEGRPFDSAEAAARIATERALVEGADAIACVSEAEAALFAACRVPVHVISHAVSCAVAPPGWQERAGFLFVGRLLETAAPNWQGMAWFIRDCWPLIRKALPRATLTIAGHLNADHEALMAPGVRLLGPVDDLSGLYDAARLFIAPVRFAAGVPLKVLEAAGAGIPVVGTGLMAAQLDWRPGLEMATADEPRAFAEAAVALYNDRQAWTAMQGAALARVRREHDQAVFTARLAALLDGRPPVTEAPVEDEAAAPGGLGFAAAAQ